MIGYLNGKILSTDQTSLLLDVQGVGYEVFVGANADTAFGTVGAALKLWIYTYVREDQLVLYGFKDALQKRIFLILTSISGIGPKLAMAVISSLSPAELTDAVSMGNTTPLKAVPGVGKKMADRMVLELKDKLSEFVKEFELSSTATDNAVWRDLSDALTGLGFQDSSIRAVVRLLRTEHSGSAPDINTLLKSALQKIKNC